MFFVEEYRLVMVIVVFKNFFTGNIKTPPVGLPFDASVF